MPQVMKGTLRFVVAAVTAVVLLFGVTEALASSPACTDPDMIGSCPPFTATTCGPACVVEGFFGGNCVGGCCLCFE